MAHDLTAVSLFSGVGGLDEGLRRAGFRHVLMCESDGYRRDVLRAWFPGVPIADDVRLVANEQPDSRTHRPDASSGAVGEPRRDGWPTCADLVCGGFPCQDLSVAGNRAGLNGSRSGLFFEYARIADALRPGWLLVENVPGLLSSNGGRDFGIVLGTLADLGYGLAWRILDSRYFGVPQRRRRVFIVGARADDDPRASAERAGQVLAVGTRCPGHPATRGEAGHDVAVASLSGLGTGGPDDNDGQGGRLVTAHALTSEGHDASEDGTGRGTPLVAPALVKRYGKGTDSDATDAFVIAAPLSHGPNPNSNAAGRRCEDDENLVAYAPLAGALGGGNDGAGRRTEDDPNLVAYPTSGDALRGEGTALTPSPDAEGRIRLRDPGFAIGGDGDPAFTLSATSPGAVAAASVRRLTPTECERLQAFPDGWTDLGGTPDSKRYAALGDAVTVNVAEWIGRRIVAAS